MDVIIPSHNIKTLSNAVSALAKIGKFLYLEFDPLTGLTLRTLNDAKSSFAEFTFDVGFFERCSSGAAVLNNDDGNVIAAGGGMLLSTNTRTRKNNLKSTKNNKIKRKTNDGKSATKASNSRRRQQQQQQDHDGDEEEEEDCEKYLCRVPIRTIASLLHYRKGLLSLRIRSINPASSDFPSLTDTSSVTSSSITSRPSASLSKMQLSFEFRIQPSFGGGGGVGQQQQGIMFVTHRVFVSQSPSVVASASRTNCSEIVVDPVLWLKLIDPVQSPEMVLIVSERDRRVTASSFHYADGGGGSGGGDDQQEGNSSSSSRNLVLSATASRVLKTETSVHCDEFDEFVYSDGDRVLTENGSSGDGAIDLPEGIEHQVVLVFSSREAKAMVQFCVQQAGGKVDEMGELRLIVNFYWGGKPIVFETEGDAFQGVLILSTVHYSLLKGIVDWTTATSKKKSKIGSTK